MKFNLRALLAAALGGFSLSSCVVDPYGMPLAGPGLPPPPAVYSGYSSVVYDQPVYYDAGYSPYYRPVSTSFTFFGSRGCDRPVYTAPVCATPPRGSHHHYSSSHHRVSTPRPFGLSGSPAPIRHGQSLHRAPTSPFSGGIRSTSGDCTMPRLESQPRSSRPVPGFQSPSRGGSRPEPRSAPSRSFLSSTRSTSPSSGQVVRTSGSFGTGSRFDGSRFDGRPGGGRGRD